MSLIRCDHCNNETEQYRTVAIEEGLLPSLSYDLCRDCWERLKIVLEQFISRRNV